MNFFLILMAFVLLVASIFNWLTVQFYLISVIEAVLSVFCFWSYYRFRTQLDLAATSWIVSSITGLIAIILIIPFSLILSDLDHFKRVNDTYGHHIGDCVLKEYATIISERKRYTDHLSRWGGEEFVLILPNTKLLEGETVVRSLIEAVRRHQFKDVGGITVSMGVGEFNDLNNRVDFFKTIDRALYEAKQQGRDRYVLAVPAPAKKKQPIDPMEHAQNASLYLRA